MGRLGGGPLCGAGALAGGMKHRRDAKRRLIVSRGGGAPSSKLNESNEAPQSGAPSNDAGGEGAGARRPHGNHVTQDIDPEHR
jgi:hypothetical protein